jgi:MFS family permease
VLFRSLSGFGMSEQAVNAAYLNEILGSRKKGFLYGIVQAGWPAGVMLSALIAGTLTPVVGWRGTFLIATFPLLVMLVLRKWLKESPYFEKMRHMRTLVEQGDLRAAKEAGDEWGLELPHKGKNTYSQIFAPGLRKHTVSLGAMFFLKLIGDSQMTVLATTVLVHGKGVDLTSALWTVFLGNGVAFLGYIIFGYLGDRLGRRETVIACEVLAALSTIFLLTAAHGFFVVVISYSMVLFFAQGAAAPLFAYVGESYPTRVRGTGAAFIGITGPIGGVVGPLLFAALQSMGLDAATAALSGAVAALLAGTALLWARRIRPGQELADVSH